ncbi:Gfo/Idh/MocA family protein [Gryllotalpicola reticulitermitis]|uniref:Gfo/Idh/MocA family protein n=1 Tax=Gryllotalpicola reticulitermitis TaxID=1184153 RepID=A0ABV8QCA5_9MICO
MSTPITFGVIGLDHWYSAIPLAKAVAAHPDAVLAGIADTDIARAQEVAAQTGDPAVTDDLFKLIEDDSIDVIASFASVDQNPDIVVAAAEAGKHIVSIKPLALTLAEADRIRAAVHKAGVVFVPGESRSRGADQNRWLKDYVESGKLGRITSAQFSLSGSLPMSWPGGEHDGGWWVDPKRGPGGGWVDHSLYQIDRMRWLLGEEVAEVSGRVANLVHRDLAVEDYGHAIVVFDGGAIASIEDTWSGPAGGWRIATSIVGTSGSLHLDTSTGMIAVLETDGTHQGWVQLVSPSDHTVGLEEILTSVRGPEKAIATVDDAWENLAAAIAFYEAAASGTAVRPPHLRDQ